jgi:prophage regulatory protein
MTEHLQTTLDKVITLIAHEIADRCVKEIERLSAESRSQSVVSNAAVQTAPAKPKVENTLLKIKQVQDRVSLSRSSIYKMLNREEFPKPIKIGARTAWSEASITQWIAGLQRTRAR